MPLTVNFTANQTVGQAPLIVSFTLSDVIGTSTGWAWDFGDGNTSTLKNPENMYQAAGNYTVTVVATNGVNTSTITKVYFINVVYVDFSVSVLSGYEPLSVQFTDNTAIPNGINIYGWLWAFGDDNTSNLQSPTHSYTTGGTYTVSLTVYVVDSNNKLYDIIITKSDYIEVKSTPIRFSSKFIAIGWIKSPIFGATNAISPFVIGDTHGNLSGVDSVFDLNIIKEGIDYRLCYSGSKTKLINMNYSIDISDGNWHFLIYMCTDDLGTMVYYIDNILIDSEVGVDINGLSYSTARTTSSRQGGGTIWCPHLIDIGSSLSVYNWRMSMGLNLGIDFLNDLMVIDKQALGI